MYVGGTDDLMGFLLSFPFLSAEDKVKQCAFVVEKATSRYFPAYEKVRRRITSSYVSFSFLFLTTVTNSYYYSFKDAFEFPQADAGGALLGDEVF